MISLKPLHCKSVSDVVTLLSTDPRNGLTELEAHKRLGEYGPNEIPSEPPEGSIKRFLRQFHNPLIYILLIASGVTFFMAEYTDSLVIFLVVLVNAVVGFVQEGKAVEALESLSRSVGSMTTVIRDGRKQRIEVTAVIPGDLVVLESGDRIPADLRLTYAKDLRVAEAALTGESIPVSKHTDVLPDDTVLGDRKNMAWASTNVTYGVGRGVVVATGTDTEVGKISDLMRSQPSLDTPLTRDIKKFSEWLLWAIMILAGMTAGIGIYRGETLYDMFIAAVALSVGAIPEGLPAAVTIILAIGVNRMASRKAIIRRLAAVETLGGTTVICSDKTGTLTLNQMAVTVVVPVNGVQETDILECGYMCSTATAEPTADGWKSTGDPTEVALVMAAVEADLPHAQSIRPEPVDEIPFSSEDKFMATMYRQRHGGHRIYVKGALDILLEWTADDGDYGWIKDKSEEISRTGLRVLAFAYRDVSESHVRLERADLVGNLSFLGIAGMADPPRNEAKLAVQQCQSAGIAVKMITGDHAATASTIAQQLTLEGERDENGLRAITGRELDLITDQGEFDRMAGSVSVFARVSPEHKHRLVESLQRQNHIVAMTGDGVNDAPALKAANIGVAMGKSGTDVAKDASDMVLTDDNFATIVNAVEEGRTVYDNLQKFIVWTIPTNIGEGFVILAAIALGVVLPLLPVHILWINMCTAIVLGMTLAFEPTHPDIMKRKPRDPGKPILSKELFMRAMLVGSILLVAAFGIFLFEQYRGMGDEVARTSAANVFVLLEMAYLFQCRTLLEPIKSIGWFSNPWVWAGSGLMLLLQLCFTYLPFMNKLFSTAPVDLLSWVIIVASGIVLMAIVAFEKSMRRRFGE